MLDSFAKYYEKGELLTASVEDRIETSCKDKDGKKIKRSFETDFEESGKRYINKNDLYADPLLFYYEAEDVQDAPIGHDWIQVGEANPGQEECVRDDLSDSSEEAPSPTVHTNRAEHVLLMPGVAHFENFPPTTDVNVKLLAKKLREDSVKYSWEFFYTNLLLHLLEFVKCHREYVLVIKGLNEQEKLYVEYVITCLGSDDYESILDFENCWQVNILFYIKMNNSYSLRIVCDETNFSAPMCIIKTAHPWSYVILPKNMDDSDKELIIRKPPPQIPLPVERPIVRPIDINPLLNPNLLHHIIQDIQCRSLKFMRLKLVEFFIINWNILKCCLLNLNLVNLSLTDFTIEVPTSKTFVPNRLEPLLLYPVRPFLNPFIGLSQALNRGLFTPHACISRPLLHLNVPRGPIPDPRPMFLNNPPYNVNPVMNPTNAMMRPNFPVPMGVRPNFVRHPAPEPVSVRPPMVMNHVRPDFNNNCYLMPPAYGMPVNQYPMINGPMRGPMNPNFPCMPPNQMPPPNHYAPRMYRPMMDPNMRSPVPNQMNPPVRVPSAPNQMNIPVGVPPAYNQMNPVGVPPAYNQMNPVGVPPASNQMNPVGVPPASNQMNPVGVPPASNQTNLVGVPPASNQMKPPIGMPCPRPIMEPNIRNAVPSPVNPIPPPNSKMLNPNAPQWNPAVRVPPVRVMMNPNMMNASPHLLNCVCQMNRSHAPNFNKLPFIGAPNMGFAIHPNEKLPFKPVLVCPSVLRFLSLYPSVMDPMSTDSKTVRRPVARVKISAPNVDTQSVTPNLISPMSIDLTSPSTSTVTSDTNEVIPNVNEVASDSPGIKDNTATQGTGTKASLTSNEGTKTATKLVSFATDTANLVTGEGKEGDNNGIKRTAARFFAPVKNWAKSHTKDDKPASSGIKTAFTKPTTPVAKEIKTIIKGGTQKLNTNAKITSLLKVAVENATQKDGDNSKVTTAAKMAIPDTKEGSPMTIVEGPIKGDATPTTEASNETPSTSKAIKTIPSLKKPELKLPKKIEKDPKMSPLLNVMFDESYFKGKRKKFGAKYNDKVIEIVQSFLRFAANDNYTEFMFLGPFEPKESEAICIFFSLYLRNTFPYGDMYRDLEHLLNCHRRDAKETYTITDSVDANYVIYKEKTEASKN